MPYCITWEGEGFIYLFNPYSEDFIKDLKAAIPEPYRWWDYMDKVWLIHERYRNKALYIASRYFKTKPVIEYPDYRRLLQRLDGDGLKAVWRQVAYEELIINV
jgi:hypothetical protein